MGSGDISVRVREKRFRRRVRQRQKKHRRLKGHRVWPAARSRRAPAFIKIFVPEEISLRHYSHREATLRTCSAIRKSYLQEKSDIILDFSRTRKIAADGMLLLVAEIDRSMRMGRQEQIIRCRLPMGDTRESRVVREVLDQIGLLHRIGHSPPPSKNGDSEYDETVRHWRYATGTRVDEKPGDVLDEHEGRIAQGLMTGVQTGLSEALVNSLHHAYRGDREDGCVRFNERRWWMFTNEKDGKLNVMVCDLGIGIPRSLPLTWDRGFLKKLAALLGGKTTDSAAIRMALVLGESSTGEENRGKGLPQIWNATRASNAGGVGILSGKAYVSFDGETGQEHDALYRTSLLGTLVMWTFPVETTVGTDG